MSTQNLSRVTLQTLENYARCNAGRRCLSPGGHRLVGVVNGALEERVYPVPPGSHRVSRIA